MYPLAFGAPAGLREHEFAACCPECWGWSVRGVRSSLRLQQAVALHVTTRRVLVVGALTGTWVRVFCVCLRAC